MASGRVAEREVLEEEARRTADLHLSPHKHSLLIIVGRTAHPGQTGLVAREIERGTFLRGPHPSTSNSSSYHQQLQLLSILLLLNRMSLKNAVEYFPKMNVEVAFNAPHRMDTSSGGAAAPAPPLPPHGASRLNDVLCKKKERDADKAF